MINYRGDYHEQVLHIFLSLIFITSANARATTSFAELINQYEVAVRVYNTFVAEAAEELTKQILKSQITQAEIMDYPEKKDVFPRVCISKPSALFWSTAIY